MMTSRCTSKLRPGSLLDDDDTGKLRECEKEILSPSQRMKRDMYEYVIYSSEGQNDYSCQQALGLYKIWRGTELRSDNCQIPITAQVSGPTPRPSFLGNWASAWWTVLAEPLGKPWRTALVGSDPSPANHCENRNQEPPATVIVGKPPLFPTAKFGFLTGCRPTKEKE